TPYPTGNQSVRVDVRVGGRDPPPPEPIRQKGDGGPSAGVPSTEYWLQFGYHHIAHLVRRHAAGGVGGGGRVGLEALLHGFPDPVGRLLLADVLEEHPRGQDRGQRADLLQPLVLRRRAVDRL